MLDIDAELNRLDMRSCFRAWSLAMHFQTLAKQQFFIQTRQRDHYVIQALANAEPQIFYKEDMKIRKELEFSPFGHQVLVALRSKVQKTVQKMSEDLFEQFSKQKLNEIKIHQPTVEVIGKKRDQYRMNILLQGPEVIAMITFIKQAMTKIKRSSKVIITINVDP